MELNSSFILFWNCLLSLLLFTPLTEMQTVEGIESYFHEIIDQNRKGTKSTTRCRYAGRRGCDVLGVLFVKMEKDVMFWGVICQNSTIQRTEGVKDAGWWDRVGLAEKLNSSQESRMTCFYKLRGYSIIKRSENFFSLI